MTGCFNCFLKVTDSPAIFLMHAWVMVGVGAQRDRQTVCVCVCLLQEIIMIVIHSSRRLVEFGESIQGDLLA